MNYQISEKMVNFIAKFEGFSRYIYNCPGGFATIGYGHVLRSSEFFKEITESEALILLKKDILEVISQTKNYLTNFLLNKNQLISLTSFVFNLGIKNFAKSDLLRLTNLRQIREAAAEFKKWNKSAGKILPGLTRRREAESLLFLEYSF